jgi:hypothetical protein
MQLTALFIYPVKSLRGFAVPSAEVDALGFDGDRRFMVIDDQREMLTQRSHPQLAKISTALTESSLILSAEGHASLTVARRTPPEFSPTPVTVSVWGSKNLIAEDCGPEATQWLSRVIGIPARLVRIGEHFHRPVLYKPAYAPPSSAATLTSSANGRIAAADIVTFADGYPFLITSEASLGALNDRLIARDEEPVPMDRFRPSLVISGCGAFAEDTWRNFQIGDLTFRAAGPCSRCIMTTTDQLTGERSGPEPLRTLAAFRRDPDQPSAVNFGQNVVHLTKSGTLSVGDSVVPLTS